MLFVGVAILLPAFHMAHCADNHGSHEIAHCPICQFINTQVITTTLHITPIAQSLIVGNVDIPPSFIPSAPLRGAAMARAPPAA